MDAPISFSVFRRFTSLAWMRPIIGALALAAAVGCAGSDDGTEDQDNAAITAEQANRQGYSLKEHLVKGQAASAEAQSKLGIAKWDVFTGIDAGSGFQGVVIYASDADGDVKFVYSADRITKSILMLALTKSGTPDESVKLTNEQSVLLGGELTKIETAVKEASSRLGACAKAAALGGLAIATSYAAVMVAGIGIGAIGWFVAPIPIAVMGALSESTVSLLIGAAGSVVTFVAGTGAWVYTLYVGASAVAGSIADNGSRCLTGEISVE